MKVTTLLSPAMFESSITDIQHKTIVVIDILRATSTMTVAMENGARAIYPVRDIETASRAGSSFVKAGERNGEKVEGFDLGNSPREFNPDIVRNRDIVMTTTNGTRAIAMSENAQEILIASYRNIDATLKHVKASGNDVVLFCSGWKDVVNVEDTLFAGELASKLQQSGYEIENDATHVAIAVYLQHQNQPKEIINQASHAQRISRLSADDDIDICLMRNTYHEALKVVDGVVIAS
jgi:2-phosphosulfolactate phosphatase